MIHKITPSIDYYYWFNCLNTQINESINPNSEVPKIVAAMNKKTSFETCHISSDT